MPHPIDQFVGQKTRALRAIRGMTQQQLAAEIGVKFQQVQKYETGANRISASRLSEIAAALDAPITAFFPDAGTTGDKQIIDPRLYPIAHHIARMDDHQADTFFRAMNATAAAITGAAAA